MFRLVVVKCILLPEIIKTTAVRQVVLLGLCRPYIVNITLDRCAGDALAHNRLLAVAEQAQRRKPDAVPPVIVKYPNPDIPRAPPVKINRIAVQSVCGGLPILAGRLGKRIFYRGGIVFIVLRNTDFDFLRTTAGIPGRVVIPDMELP